MPFRPLLQARPTDPFVQWMVRDLEPERLLTDGDHIAWTWGGRNSGEVWVTALGEDPDRCVALVRRISEQTHVDGVTVPDQAFSRLPIELQSQDSGHWCFWVLSELDPSANADSALELDRDDPRIRGLLEHSTSAHVFPGDPELVRWVGVEEDGKLQSVAGQITEGTGAAHIVSVCTDPDARGRGLARATCARLVQLAIADGAPAVVLEMYADNEAGRRTYSSLGFVETGRYRSGLLRTLQA